MVKTWHLQPRTYFKTISSDNNEQSSLSITPGDNNSFKLICLKQIKNVIVKFKLTQIKIPKLIL
ncbi:hypothetical protein DICPUDRAFT_158370 [Dictyostelium purpureum]|uniref:Uncharacterized protein n=1 Tax=Dictyostelium purpureum TaxID=5786 RepID=F1A1G3_DICPU|nr:uncharacterized protein DICPUDRAFT_158370 [Dictyostelium purpureum]EGC29965.1 hypothetical protein DICPUDRAFT_158370 [Dictyostelium purpureum]|eukprot:XP_003293504.1 hypothetical protein DICPUDRAFT_158370 [Dictyostelium purpureum]